MSTWLFHNGSWSELNGTGTPDRSDAGLAYDGYDGYMVLYGGFVQPTGAFSSQTWIFYRGNWIQIDPTQTPSATASFAMTYDPAAQELVLVGGYAGTNAFNATWLFRQGQWSPGPQFPGPALYDPLMAYESATGALILFGGTTNSGPVFDQTWAFRIGGWSWVNAPISPPAPALWPGSMASDPGTGGVVLVEAANQSYSGGVSTWSYLEGH